MASATLPTTFPTVPPPHRPWPADAPDRWALRLALGLPLVALGVWANVRGFESSSHRTFAAQAAAVRAGGSDLAGLGAAYPPLPTLLAGIVPGGSLGLSVVASLVAGCTLHLVWEQLVRRDVPTVLIGFNTASEVFYAEQFEALGARVLVTTADGSRGKKGFVTDAVGGLEYTYFYACGPEPMFRALDAVLTTPGEFSFEARMGCGFGACMGCSCKTKYGYKRICRDGPVMKREEIIW